MRYLFLTVFALCVIVANNLENFGENCSNYENDLLDISTNISAANGVETSDLNFTIKFDAIGDKGKICLRNVTECIEKDSKYRSTTDRLASFLFTSLPPFDLSHVQGVSPECRRQSKRYLEDLENFQLWALKMYDSTAKIPSGILNGNLNQLGDFDMCLGAVSENYGVKGQYCLAEFEIQSPKSSYLSGLYNLIQSHHHFRSKLEDPGHRVPRFSSFNWALCVPSACTSQDVELGFKKTIKQIIDETEIEIRYRVDSTMCQKNEDKDYPTSTYITLFIFGAILAWEVIATLYDLLSVGEKNKWVMAFSIKENFMSCITLDRSRTDIEAIHGIRCLNAILLLASHKSMAIFFQPAPNRTAFIEYISRPFSVLGRAASLYTDPFIMMSGLLTAYTLLGKLNRTRRINIIEEYVSRLFRIVPALAAVIAFCTFIFPFISSGPLWNTVVTHHSDVCKKHWWRNMLFIHNYFGFKDMCLQHTHHLGIDTQLFFASPFLIYLIWRWPKRGGLALVGLATVSTIMRYYVTYTQKLSNYVHFGTSVQQLFDTADNMYILPAHRATVYIMGILLGYVLRNSKIQLTKTQLNIGNTVAISSLFISIFGPAFMGKIDYVYNPRDAAWYAAYSPILWCFSFAWIIFTWHLGYKIIAGYVFSNKLFLIWTKISYTVYLTQFPIYFYNVGTTRSSNEVGFIWMILSLREYAWVIGLSLLLTLVIEMPFHKVRQVYLHKGMKRKIISEQETDDKMKKL